MEPQTFSHWPSWPLPVAVPRQEVSISARHVCSYLPDRYSVFRAFESERLTADEIQRLMDAGFRRSGSIIYQPMCPGCRRCTPIRVPVPGFKPSKSQRRVMKRNTDVVVRVSTPEPTTEKWHLYERYQREWHDGKQAGDPMGFVAFLYRSPVECVEFEYRTRIGKLLGVGLCDVGARCLSSLYFYFDPSERHRSIGTYSALYELTWARQMAIPYWYAGYWVEGCQSMEYKSRFRPCELLGTDGVWRPVADDKPAPASRGMGILPT